MSFVVDAGRYPVRIWTIEQNLGAGSSQNLKKRLGYDSLLFILSLLSDKLSWGNQEPVWPVSAAALGAVPSARIQHLAKHKRDFSAREDHRRKEEEEEESFFRKTPHPPCKTSQYENIFRLSTPKTRSRSFQQAGPHTSHCDRNCPIWHVDPRVKSAVIPPRLLQLSNPRLKHPDSEGDRGRVASVLSLASRGARSSQRLLQLALPRIKQTTICCELGRPEESIWTVSGAARRATASPRLEMLATPKQLSADYVPPREPEWTWTNTPPPT
ncbi:hypothetical protein Q8A73_011155 [Channa argus]|nr:hypothetical protein Q8A73_011155 [Channa argus]